METRADEGRDRALGDDPAPEEIIVGTIERVTFSDVTSLYSVLRIAPDPEQHASPSGSIFRPALVTAVGRTDAPVAGMRVRLRGHWIEHREHGAQFQFDLLELLAPADRAGLIKYLASSKFAGIGEKLAARIVETLGDDALDEILEHPEKLHAVRGLKPAVRESLIAAAMTEIGTHRANVYLRSLGLGPWQAAAILRKLGPTAEARVRADPYLLATGIAGIGLRTADRIAASMGLAADDPRRVRAVLLHALKIAAGEGHSLLERANLIEEARSLLTDVPAVVVFQSALKELENAGEITVEVPAGSASRTLEQASEPDRLDGGSDSSFASGGDHDRIYLPSIARCEAEFARNLALLIASAPVRALADDVHLRAVERAMKLELHPLQREAVLGLLGTPVGLLTGGPGVGKTTIVRSIVALAQAAHARVLLASPTGRAAKRLAEATGHEAQTIHRLLGYEPQDGGFLHDARNPLEADLVIVDEISMLDIVLAHHLLKAIQPPTRLIFVGDPNQLPSVGPGNVLHDVINSGVAPVFRLAQIYRQAQDSLIVTNAHRILQGELPLIPPSGDHRSDFYFFQCEEPRDVARRLVEVVTKRIPHTFGLNWIDDVQVIAPMYRGECGVDALNELLRAENAGGTAVQREIRQDGKIWRTGDRVIHTRNNYEKEVFNGDMGRIEQVFEDASLLVRFPEREIVYTKADLAQLQPAFAITVHRSQGAEFPAVVIPLVMQHFMMLQRHLLYTAVTRARRLVVLVGSQQAIRWAVVNAEQSRRGSALAERLRQGVRAG